MYVIIRLVEIEDMTEASCFKLTNSLDGLGQEVENDLHELEGCEGLAIRFDYEEGCYEAADYCGTRIRYIIEERDVR